LELPQKHSVATAYIQDPKPFSALCKAVTNTVKPQKINTALNFTVMAFHKLVEVKVYMFNLLVCRVGVNKVAETAL
jgi:hypothetical protein